MMYGHTQVLGVTVTAAGTTGAYHGLAATGLAAGGRVLLAVGLMTVGLALTTLARIGRRREAHQRP
jgi:hypothetical protein